MADTNDFVKEHADLVDFVEHAAQLDDADQIAALYALMILTTPYPPKYQKLAQDIVATIMAGNGISENEKNSKE